MAVNPSASGSWCSSRVGLPFEGEVGASSPSLYKVGVGAYRSGVRLLGDGGPLTPSKTNAFSVLSPRWRPCWLFLSLLSRCWWSFHWRWRWRVLLG